MPELERVPVFFFVKLKVKNIKDESCLKNINLKSKIKNL